MQKTSHLSIRINVFQSCTAYKNTKKNNKKAWPEGWCEKISIFQSFFDVYSSILIHFRPKIRPKVLPRAPRERIKQMHEKTRKKRPNQRTKGDKTWPSGGTESAFQKKHLKSKWKRNGLLCRLTPWWIEEFATYAKSSELKYLPQKNEWLKTH